MFGWHCSLTLDCKNNGSILLNDIDLQDRCLRKKNTHTVH